MAMFKIEFGGMKDGHFHRNMFYPFDNHISNNLDKFLTDYNYTDTFMCMYKYDGDDIKTCNIISDLYFDFDMDNKDIGRSDKEKYDDLKFQVMRILALAINTWKIDRHSIELYYSGYKGFHMIIPSEVFGLTPCSSLNAQFKRIALYFKLQFSTNTLDIGIYDRRRLFRIPNTVNSKSGLYKVPITIEQLRSYSLEEMHSWAAEPRDYPECRPIYSKEAATSFKKITGGEGEKYERAAKHKIVLPKEHKPMLPCVDNMLKASISAGARNNTLVALSSSIIQAGYTEKETAAILSEWNQNNNPPLPEDELKKTVWSAWHMIENGVGYGCQKFKELGACIGTKCRLISKR